MSNAIGRARYLGIAIESTYGVPATAAKFVVPLLDTPLVETMVMKERNTALLGNTYQADSLVRTNRKAMMSLNVKVDERHLPMFFRQKFSISTATTETGVYTHTLSYQSTTNDGKSYTLFLIDSNRTSTYMSGVKFGALNVFAERSFLRLEAECEGAYPVTFTGSAPTVGTVNEFVGRNAVFNYGLYGTTKTTTEILSATFNHEFALSSDEENFILGQEDIEKIYTTEDVFTGEVMGLFSDFATFRNTYTANTAVMYDLTISDTARTLGTSSSPQIKFDYPVGYLETWGEEGAPNELTKETVGLFPVARPGVSGAPLTITVRTTEPSTSYN